MLFLKASIPRPFTEPGSLVFYPLHCVFYRIPQVRLYDFTTLRLCAFDGYSISPPSIIFVFMDIKAPSMHIGRKISRIRELRGMKQEVLASELGMSQQAVSRIEQSEEVEEGTLEKIAKALQVPVEAIKNFNEEAVLNVISNTFTSNDSSTLNAINMPSFNPIDKVVELYERLLASEREKIELLKGK